MRNVNGNGPMGCDNLSGPADRDLRSIPVADDISGNAVPSASRIIHHERHGSKYQSARTGSSGKTTKRNAVEQRSELPALRFEIPEASRILRMSRAQLYHRIGEGAIRIQKDGARTYITMGELERYPRDSRGTLLGPIEPSRVRGGPRVWPGRSWWRGCSFAASYGTVRKHYRRLG